MSDTPTVQPATDEQVAEMKADTSYGHSCDLDELLSLIARIEAEDEYTRKLVLGIAKHVGIRLDPEGDTAEELVGLLEQHSDEFDRCDRERRAAEAREKALREALKRIATSPRPLPDTEDAEGWATLAAERREIARAALSQTKGEQPPPRTDQSLTPPPPTKETRREHAKTTRVHAWLPDSLRRVRFNRSGNQNDNRGREGHRGQDIRRTNKENLRDGEQRHGHRRLPTDDRC